MFILFAVRAQLNPILLRDDQRDLQDIDRVETQTFAIECSIRCDFGSGHIEIQRLDDEIRELGLQGGTAGRLRRLSNERRVVRHTGNN